MKNRSGQEDAGFIPHQYRVRQPLLTVASSSAPGQQASSVIEVSSQSSWTRGSYVSSFIDGELGSTFRRWMRNAGRLVVNPIDNFIGTRELEKVYAYLYGLDAMGWRNLKDQFDAERYAPRLIEVIRYPVYPRKLRLLAQRITLELAIFGHIHFHQVNPRIHFHSKDEFSDSIRALCTLALELLPKTALLSYIPLTDDVEDFLSSLRSEIKESAKDGTFIQDDTFICRLIRFSKADCRWEEAEELELALLHSRRQLLGEEHPDTLISLGNLAVTYWNQRRWDEAEELHTKVTEARRRILGDEHPDTLTSIGNLASTYLSQNRLKEAEELERNLISVKQRILGEGHPSTLNSFSNLASNYWMQGRRKEAEELNLKILDTMNRLAVEDHPLTLTILGSLALNYECQGPSRWEEAEHLYNWLMTVRTREFGGDHLSTIDSIENLVTFYCRQGRWKEAGEARFKAVEARKRVQGEEHPHTLNNILDLAWIYSKQGRWMEAEQLSKKVISMRERVLDEDHPDMFLSLGTLAEIYAYQSRLQEAAGLGSKTPELMELGLGKEHPDTLTHMNDTA